MRSTWHTPLQISLKEANREKVGLYIFMQCIMQAEVFENSVGKGYDSQEFIRSFMNSEMTRYWDMPYDRHQMMCWAYNMEELEDECGNLPQGIPWNKDVMFWLGFIYRYWHFYKKTTSKKIYMIVNPETIARMYLEYHPVSCDIVIDKIIEEQKRK